jgi:hypothetical protein
VKEFEVTGEIVTLPLEHAAFPPRCLGCGAPSTTAVELYKQRGIDLVVHKHIRFVKLSVPACSACKQRKRATHIAGWLPLVVVIAWWVVVGPLREFREIDAQVDAILIAAGASFLLGYYGARRFAERGFGAWIAEMAPLGETISVHCRDWRDASDAADLSRKNAGIIDVAVAAAIDPAARALTAEAGERIELRYAPRRVGLRLLIPLGLLAVTWAMFEFGGFYYTGLLWLGAVLALLFITRLLDRRARLTLDRDGFTYKPWGAASLSWREVESVRLVHEQFNWFVDIRPVVPEALAAQLPLLERLSGTFLNSTRPRFSLDLTLLERDPREIFALISTRVSEHAPH